MKKLLLLSTLFLSMLVSMAQNRSIRGRIIDDNGQPVRDVSITVKDMKSGTTSGPDGTFVLNVPSTARSLVITSVGFQDQEVLLGNKSSFEIGLSKRENKLDQVVVIAYGTQDGDAFAVDALYNLYAPTDVRKDWMIPTARGGQPIKAVNKYPNTNNPDDKDDIKIIRYAEVLLILAEAYARTAEEANALSKLNQVAKQRDPAFARYTSNGQTLIDNIITERRKELAFEGDRYWDLARLKRDVVRINLNNNYPSNTPLTLPATSNKRVWPIPQDEIDANDIIMQNTGY